LTAVNEASGGAAHDENVTLRVVRTRKERTVNNRGHGPAPHVPTGGVRHYGERIFNAERHDPYEQGGKYREPTQCSGCGAVWHRGRWQWGAAPAGAEPAMCPACRRIHDKLPAGTIVLDGPFVAGHRDELVRLARNEAEREGRDHPLHRLMQVAETPGRVVMETTDIHLPQRIGEALQSAYDGELDVRYGDNEYSARVVWRR
jgi:hypothetical protein